MKQRIDTNLVQELRQLWIFRGDQVDLGVTTLAATSSSTGTTAFASPFRNLSPATRELELSRDCARHNQLWCPL
jgi:hypothetical protein